MLTLCAMIVRFAAPVSYGFDFNPVGLFLSVGR